VIEMMCELFNKMDKFVNYVFDVDDDYKDEVKLWKVILMIVMFLFTLFVLSWWILPIRFIFKKYGNITFYCKNKKGE
jgi:uncharacterized BrkB/YihY/UPF0761 family membrane protein